MTRPPPNSPLFPYPPLSRSAADARLKIPGPPVRKDKANKETNQRAAAPKQKMHEPANRAVGLDPFAIINPNQREILDVVKDFEQRNADQNARHDVIAVPPERYARDQEHQLHWTWSLSANPRPDVICKKQSRNWARHRQQPLLRRVDECTRV